MNFKISIGLSLFLVLASFSSAHAQVKQCPLDLSVTQYQKNAEAGQSPISDANATAFNIVTKKVTKAVLFEGMPRFPKLREGTYNLSVIKPGYARTLKRIKIDCSGLAEDGSVSEDVFLWKGSPEQTMKMRSVVITLSSKDKTPIASQVVKPTEVVNPSQNASPKAVSQTPKTISGGVLNGKATILVKPDYPPAALAVRATGAVNVQVTIDEQGSVVSAQAVSGHPLLRQAAENAARASSFAATTLQGQPVKVTGVIVYNFVP
jgi:TonB family protein